MAKFDAATAVEAMEYDFTAYGGSEGIIPEPTTGQMNDFMVGMRRVLAEARALQKSDAQTDKDPNEMTAEELGEFMDNMEENMAHAAEFNGKIVALTAEFCSGTPSADELSKLPMRVMRAFSKFLMNEINPKEDESEGKVTPMPTRQPQDRRTGTKRSRKAGR